MHLGVVFPQTEIGDDPGLIRDFAQTAEGLGYTHLLVFDHVLGAGLAHRPDWRGPYDTHDAFHEPFVLFGYLAGLTERIELVTGVLVLPQRQTALVAKQAAEVDVLSGGRLRLGVGVGWNDVEYQALGEDFHNRGRRIEEQIVLMRALWTEPVVDFEGRWHRVPEAGINPLPVQRPIPVWLGGQAEPVLRRIGAVGDGWFPQMLPDQRARKALDRLRGYAAGNGRDPARLGVEPRVEIRYGDPADWPALIEGWRELGATHISVSTRGLGLTGAEHVAAIERLHRELDLGTGLTPAAPGANVTSRSGSGGSPTTHRAREQSMSASGEGQPNRLLAVVAAERGEIGEILDRLESDTEEIDAAERRGLVDQLLDRVAAHAVARREVLYPRVDRDLADGESVVDLATIGLDQIERTRQELAGLAGTEPTFRPLVAKFANEVWEHLEEEQSDLLPPLIDAIGAEEANELGDQLARAGAGAPPA